MGKYLLLERLATGGMAEVYRAKSTGASGFEKHLAIKRILPDHLEDDTFRRMFETEARIGSSLQHSNIVQILDFVKFGETFLLVMEFVNGKNLRQVVNKLKKLQYSLPIECTLFIINETCKGLDYAHSKKDDFTGQPQNIIHRDMSPQNIMLSYDGSVKIVDFGIANWKDKLEQTKSGVIKGKFGYMSPEQAAGEPITHLTDLFSTGIIFWELVSNQFHFNYYAIGYSTLELVKLGLLLNSKS
jgi:serine/threonine-protein kinase